MSLSHNPLNEMLPPINITDWPDASRAALLIIDMQYYDAHPKHGLCKQMHEKGMHKEYVYYTEQLAQVIPRIAQLIEWFRQKHRPVIYAVIESQLPGGEDRCLRHKRIGLHVEPGSRDGEVLDQLAPLPGELIFRKTTASLFNSTTANVVLRNMCVDHLVICGVVTNGCVEGTVRDAADLSYDVTLVEDACAAMSEELHQGALRTLRHGYARLTNTKEVMELHV